MLEIGPDFKHFMGFLPGLEASFFWGRGFSGWADVF